MVIESFNRISDRYALSMLAGPTVFRSDLAKACTRVREGGRRKFKFEACTKMATECIKFEVIDSCTSMESVGD